MPLFIQRAPIYGWGDVFLLAESNYKTCSARELRPANDLGELDTADVTHSPTGIQCNG